MKLESESNSQQTSSKVPMIFKGATFKKNESSPFYFYYNLLASHLSTIKIDCNRFSLKRVIHSVFYQNTSSNANLSTSTQTKSIILNP